MISGLLVIVTGDLFINVVYLHFVIMSGVHNCNVAESCFVSKFASKLAADDTAILLTYSND